MYNLNHLLRSCAPVALLGLLFILLVVKIAWVGDDAYISFRALEQLYAGNGPNWSGLERVQVYTSPLWFWMLALVRGISDNAYLNAIVLSILLDIALVIYCLSRRANFLFAALLLIPLMLSNSFMDFTTSGLENPLIYLLLAIFIFNCHDVFTDKDKTALMPLLLAAAGLLVTRHDLLMVVIFPLLFLLLHNPLSLSPSEKIKSLLLALLPLALWTTLSLVYYGMPFPNTAYAKLNLGIPHIELIKQGLFYFFVGIKHDIISIILLLSGFIYLLTRKNDSFSIAMALSLLLDCIYIIWIGGDFMSGRFYSHLVLLALLASLLALKQDFSNAQTDNMKLTGAMIALGLCYGIFYPHTPLNSKLIYDRTFVRQGVGDERGFYSPFTSLWLYIGKTDDYYFCNRKSGTYLQWSKPYEIDVAIGVPGYTSPVDAVILDPPALSNVFLARMPRAGDDWAIGHTFHQIPKGYPESLIAKRPLMDDPALDAYFMVVSGITRSDQLFSSERLKQIILFNIGYYDHLIRESKLYFPNPANIVNIGWTSPGS
jgi:arabinofuranosyltransferase